MKAVSDVERLLTARIMLLEMLGSLHVSHEYLIWMETSKYLLSVSMPLVPNFSSQSYDAVSLAPHLP